MTTITPDALTGAPAERAAIYKVASDMLVKDYDPGLIAAYLREEARRHPAAFLTDRTGWVECPCSNLADTPTWLGCCSTDCDENELLWAHLRDALRASAAEVTVTRVTSGRGVDRPDVRVLPLTGPQSPGEAWA